MKAIQPLALALLVALSAPVIAQQAAAQGDTTIAKALGRGEAVRTLRASATLTAIDKASRTLTLKAADGRSFALVAGAEVHNFDQLRVGDKVVVAYVEALAIELKKGGGGKVERIDSAGGGRAEGGPGAAFARQVTATGDVIALDDASQTATLRGPKRTVTLRVPDLQQFKLIAIGDQVQITYTEAVAVSVDPAAKK